MHTYVQIWVIGIEIMQPRHTNISTLSESEWVGYGCSVPPCSGGVEYLQLFHTSICIGILIPIAYLVSIAASVTQSVVSTHSVLAYDAGSYDAGISTSNTSSTSWCRDSYAVVLMLLAHEVVAICVIPEIRTYDPCRVSSTGIHHTRYTAYCYTL